MKFPERVRYDNGNPNPKGGHGDAKGGDPGHARPTANALRTRPDLNESTPDMKGRLFGHSKNEHGV